MNGFLDTPAGAALRSGQKAPVCRVAQVGCGHWGKNLARNFAELGALAAVVDEDAEAAQRLGHQHRVPTAGLEAVLSDETIGAVALATPAATHAALAERAVASGKHVFVEKPLALDIADAERVIAMAEAAGCVLMVGHLLQYHPAFRRLAAIVRAGELGRLRYVYSNRMSFGKIRTEENVLWSFAPHDVSMLLALAGEEPAGVTAQGAAHVTPGIADWATAQFVFPSGLRGHAQVSWMHPFKEHRLVAVGDAGTAVFEDSKPDRDQKLAIWDHAIDTSGGAPATLPAQPRYLAVEEGEPLKEECRHFLACCATGEKPRTDGAEGLAVLRALHLAEAGLRDSLGGA